MRGCFSYLALVYRHIDTVEASVCPRKHLDVLVPVYREFADVAVIAL